jgi:hypothetical protein
VVNKVKQRLPNGRIETSANQSSTRRLEYPSLTESQMLGTGIDNYGVNEFRQFCNYVEEEKETITHLRKNRSA